MCLFVFCAQINDHIQRLLQGHEWSFNVSSKFTLNTFNELDSIPKLIHNFRCLNNNHHNKRSTHSNNIKIPTQQTINFKLKQTQQEWTEFCQNWDDNNYKQIKTMIAKFQELFAMITARYPMCASLFVFDDNITQLKSMEALTNKLNVYFQNNTIDIKHNNDTNYTMKEFEYQRQIQLQLNKINIQQQSKKDIQNIKQKAMAYQCGQVLKSSNAIFTIEQISTAVKYIFSKLNKLLICLLL